MQAHGMQNDRAQKFEYTTELCWKAIKCFLKEKEGVDEASPRKIVKAYYRGGHVTEEDYLLLLETVEGRNHLSHVYNVEPLNNILVRLSRLYLAFRTSRRVIILN